MAVLDILPEVEVTVVVDGQTAQEYEDVNREDRKDDDANRTCTKYIESKSDANFVVKVSFQKYPPGFHSKKRDRVVSTSVFVDGVKRNGEVAKVEGPLESVFQGTEAPSSCHNMVELKLFKFAPIRTVEDMSMERVERDKMTAAELGIIRVELRASVRTQRLPPMEADALRSPQFELAEKSLKGTSISHGTDFSNGSLSIARTVAITDNELHMGTFIFKYRSREDLMAELIIPRGSTTPSRSPTPNLEAMSPGRLRSLAEELLNERNVKRENSRGHIKRERTESVGARGWSQSKRARMEDNDGVVDLTEDVDELPRVEVDLTDA